LAWKITGSQPAASIVDDGLSTSARDSCRDAGVTLEIAESGLGISKRAA
jgi:hypothetical protein